MKAKRKCRGTTKKNKPCRANPLKAGTVIAGVSVSGKWCRQHDEDLPDSARIGGAQPGAGRPPKPRAVDVLRQRIEEDIDRVIDPLWEALQADKGLALNIKGGGMEIGYTADHETRIKAAKELLDRGYGKSRVIAEISGPDGGPVEIVPVTRSKAKQVGGLLAAVGAPSE